MKDKLKVHPSKYNEFGDTIENDGMDLRDYFANSAMQELIKYYYATDKFIENIPKQAYLIADAMLKQREL